MNDGYEHIIRNFGPIWDERSRILILGSFPSPKSREAAFYYGHPQNRFWPLLASILGAETPQSVEEKKKFVLDRHIALWDTLESCDIIGAGDSSIRNEEPVDICRILKGADIRAIFCNGATSHRLYGKHLEPIAGMKAIRLPSTSPANAAWSMAALADEWKIIKEYLYEYQEETMKNYQNATIFFNGKFTSGSFSVNEEGRFENVLGPAAPDAEDLHGAYVIPGLIDVHTHGNSGEDFSDGCYDGLQKMARYYAVNGVTAFAPASMTLPYEVLSKAFATARQFKETEPEGCSLLAGIHMEGPYFSEKKKGAQNGDYLKNPDFEGFRKLYEDCGGLVSIVDVAPELPGAPEFAAHAKELCTVSVAHTDASYDEAKAVFDAGASHLTHLFNAMPGIHHRKPGVIGAASENEGVIAEIICDGLHVHESAIRMAFRLFPGRICIISDSLRCAGMEDGEYELGGQQVFLQGGIAKLADGTIAGSATNLYQCLLNVIRFGIPKEDAILAATLIPAKEIGADAEMGSIADGKLANFIICDEDLIKDRVFIKGKQIL